MIPADKPWSVYQIRFISRSERWVFFGSTDLPLQEKMKRHLREVSRSKSRLYEVWRHIKEVGGKYEVECLHKTFTRPEAEHIEALLIRDPVFDSPVTIDGKQYTVANTVRKGDLSQVYVRPL